MCLTKLYKSPINYTGNKYRLLEQYKKYFPKEVNNFVDLFTGGATVSINLKAKRIVAIDNNKYVINLLNYLKKQDYDIIISKIEKMIEKYNLSNSYKYGYSHYKEYVKGNNGLKKYNEIGYNMLKNDFNKLKNKNTDKANLMLYLLMIYGFNNDMRFNARGEFNLPTGKTDMNKNNRIKLKEYIEVCKTKNIEFVKSDYQKVNTSYLGIDDFVYADPPYLITDAVYNETSGWNEKNEEELLRYLDELNNKKIKFALSNVLEKEERENIILKNWIKKNNYFIYDIQYHYRSSSYNKKNRNGKEREVLITNYKMEEINETKHK